MNAMKNMLKAWPCVAVVAQVALDADNTNTQVSSLKSWGTIGSYEF